MDTTFVRIATIMGLTLRDSDVIEQLVELLVVADGQLQVTRIDAAFLVVPGRVASQFKDFRSQILDNSCQIDLKIPIHSEESPPNPLTAEPPPILCA